jgi:hypothetical protein
MKWSIFPRIPALAILVAMAGCGTTGPNSDLRSQIEGNRALWRQLGPASYQYGVQRLCFCGPDAIGPVRVTVENGVVVSRVYTESDEPVAANLASLFPDVEGLYEVLLDAVDRDAAQIDVTWDSVAGLPSEFFIDYNVGIADEELGFRIDEVPEAS